MNADGRPAEPATHRVVIVGAGFGGLFAAKFLRRAPVQVTLIDRTNHHLFQPLLYQVATGILSEGQIAPATRDVLRKHDERAGGARGGHRVRPGGPGGDRGAARRGGDTHPYDSLIVAAGAGQSYFGHDEFAEWAPGMKTLADALDQRRRIFGAFEMAELTEDDGGAAGVADLRRRRRRPDGGRDRRPDRRAVPPRALAQLPPLRPLRRSG